MKIYKAGAEGTTVPNIEAELEAINAFAKTELRGRLVLSCLDGFSIFTYEISQEVEEATTCN